MHTLSKRQEKKLHSNENNSTFKRIKFNQNAIDYNYHQYIEKASKEFIERWTYNLPNMILQSQNIRTWAIHRSSGKLPYLRAIDSPWICPNSDEYINAITIDIDHPYIDLKLANLKDLNCPIPDIVQDPYTLRCHAIMFLTSPVRATNDKQMSFCRVVASKLATALDGSVMPHKHVTKSPFGLKSQVIGVLMHRDGQPRNPEIWAQNADSLYVWRVIEGTGEASLNQLNQALTPAYPDIQKDRIKFSKPTGIKRKSHLFELNPKRRNDTIFDCVRKHAYRHNLSDFSSLYEYATQKNSEFFGDNALPSYDIKATSRSISKWMKTKYRKNSKSASKAYIFRGRDEEHFDSNDDLKYRQSISAEQTHKYAQLDTIMRLLKSELSLEEKGKKITVKALCSESCISRQTYYNLKKSVHYGVYQILRTNKDLKEKLRNLTNSFKSDISNVEKVILLNRLAELAQPKKHMTFNPYGLNPSNVVPLKKSDIVETTKNDADSLEDPNIPW